MTLRCVYTKWVDTKLGCLSAKWNIYKKCTSPNSVQRVLHWCQNCPPLHISHMSGMEWWEWWGVWGGEASDQIVIITPGITPRPAQHWWTPVIFSKLNIQTLCPPIALLSVLTSAQATDIKLLANVRRDKTAMNCMSISQPNQIFSSSSVAALLRIVYSSQMIKRRLWSSNVFQ